VYALIKLRQLSSTGARRAACHGGGPGAASSAAAACFFDLFGRAGAAYEAAFFATRACAAANFHVVMKYPRASVRLKHVAML